MKNLILCPFPSPSAQKPLPKKSSLNFKSFFAFFLMCKNVTRLFSIKPGKPYLGPVLDLFGPKTPERDFFQKTQHWETNMFQWLKNKKKQSFKKCHILEFLLRWTKFTAKGAWAGVGKVNISNLISFVLNIFTHCWVYFLSII